MSEPCGKCGRDDGEHDWQDDDCSLSHHRKHVHRIEEALCCNGCVDRLREWLTEIVDLFVTLPAVLLDADTVQTGEYQSKRKPPEAPAPCRLEVMSLLNPGRINARYTAYNKEGTESWVESGYLGNNLPDIPAIVGGQADQLYEHLYGTETQHGLADGAAFLSANLAAVARWENLDTLDAELGWIYRTLTRTHGISRPRLTADQQQRYPALLCPTLRADGVCNAPLVPDRKERLRVKCSKCRRVFDGGMELRKLGLMIDGVA